MQAASIRAPMRAVVKGGRFSSPVGPLAYRTTSFHQHSQPTKHQARLSSLTPTHPSGLPRRRPQPISPPVLRNTSIRSNSIASNPPSNEAAPLDWNSFFRLRASRRRYSLGSSILASAATMTFGVQYLATQDLESLGTQVMGLDPFIVLGLATASCGAAGWLLGPFVGNAVWGLIYRRYRASVAIVSSPSYWTPSAYTMTRKRRSSSTASSASVWTPRRPRLRILCPITTVRKLAASRATGTGSKTKGRSTARGAISSLNLHW